jgi:hypothetical protein
LKILKKASKNDVLIVMIVYSGSKGLKSDFPPGENVLSITDSGKSQALNAKFL